MTKGIPIIMYHAILEKQNNKTHPVHIDVVKFEEQMLWLKKEGYKSISLNELINILKTNKNLPEKTIVITFDDGYLSLLQLATPILAALGFNAILFVTSKAVGLQHYNDLDGFVAEGMPENDRPLTWDELKNLSSSCWDLQSHGLNHFSLPSLNVKDLEEELFESKKLLENKLTNQIQYFAYPFGHYNINTIKFTKKKYVAAFSVHSGLATQSSDLYIIPRIEINNNDNLASFAKKVKTGYFSKNHYLKAKLRNVLFKVPLVKDAILSIIGYK